MNNSNKIRVIASGTEENPDTFEVEVAIDDILNIDVANAPDKSVIDLRQPNPTRWQTLWLQDTVEEVRAKIAKARGES